MNLFDRIEIDERSARFVFSGGVKSSGLILNDLVLDYGGGIGDLRQTPAGIVQLPALFNVAPVIWLSGLEVRLPFRDPQLEQGLQAIQAHFRIMYPEVHWDGQLIFEGDPLPGTNPRGRSAMMFSGGLDSVASLALHADEDLVLITVAGADITTDRAWAEVQLSVRQTARLFRARNAFVKGNIRDFLNYRRLSNIEPLLKHGVHWWGGAQHGLGLVGLSAPIAWSMGINRIYFASTHTSDFSVPWGSGPAIDNHIKWSGFEVVHDAFEMSRQEKIKLIIDRCESRGLARPTVRVCTSPFTDRATNCGRCEKCLRTMAGLLVENENCRAWGFDIDPKEALKRIRGAFASGDVDMRDDELFMWNDIRKRALSKPLADLGLDGWLRAFDFQAYRLACMRRQQRKGALKRGLSRIPALYKGVKLAGHMLRSLKQRAS